MLGINKLPPVSERQMHTVRWVLTVGWLLLIASLFFDPISPLLTDPQNSLSPFQFDPQRCVTVQGDCLPQQAPAIALQLFWTLIVPSSILILLVFGHETWRRICPLSFLSQIPRALGIQRKRKVLKSGTGTTRYELFKIKKDSWLGKNHLYVQFGLLVGGLSVRLLLLNANRLALGIFLLLTIGSAIAVGYLYEGKSWCQYFCPMAPVQLVFNGTRGLLGSEAHQGQKQTVTQSMCRSFDREGNEKSACVGCQSPCIDIDAERNYWETLNKPGRRLVQYGYVGLLLGFFLYPFLYAGSFDYVFSGAWLRQSNTLETSLSPGFYLNGYQIGIPRLIAVPLTLVCAAAIAYLVLTAFEKAYRKGLGRSPKPLSPQAATHVIFSLCTFFCFNVFFAFSSRTLLHAAPFPSELLFNSLIVLVSTLWLSRSLGRSAELYSRESLAGSLRRQLSKLTIDFSRFLEGRSMDDLKAEEVYVLAKVLPGVNQEQSLQVYKGVLREALEQGNTDSASSLEVLRPIRQELNLKDEDHFTILTELGLAEPDLLDSRKRRTRESQLRLESYRQALASMLLDLVDSGMSLQEAMQRQKKQLQFLKLEYGMTSEEEDQVLSQLLAGEKSTILRKAETLLEQLRQLAERDRVLSHPPDTHSPAFALLRQLAVQNKQHIITKQILGLLEMLGDAPDALELAVSTRVLVAAVLPTILQSAEGALPWSQRLRPDVLQVLEEEAIAPTTSNMDNGSTSTPAPYATDTSLTQVLVELLDELDPLIQTLALYSLNLLHPELARDRAQEWMGAGPTHWLVQETAQALLDQSALHPVEDVQTLLVHVKGGGKIERHPFQQSVVRVGRAVDNDLVISSPQVAPHHAIFYRDSDGFSVLDLGSPAGLVVGKRRLRNQCDRLTPGQTLRLGGDEGVAMMLTWEKLPLQVQAQSTTEDMGTLDKVLLLFESRFFRSLKPDALIELGRDADVKGYARGDRMCRAGDPSDSILLLIEGVADVLILRGTTEQSVSTVQAGETIGEMGVLTRQKRSASVVAASDYCRALVIRSDRFDAVLRQDPEIARNLLVVLSSRLQSMTSKIKLLSKS